MFRRGDCSFLERGRSWEQGVSAWLPLLCGTHCQPSFARHLSAVIPSSLDKVTLLYAEVYLHSSLRTFAFNFKINNDIDVDIVNERTNQPTNKHYGSHYSVADVSGRRSAVCAPLAPTVSLYHPADFLRSAAELFRLPPPPPRSIERTAGQSRFNIVTSLSGAT